MKVINDLLEYNNLKIVQDDDYFNFSLDSVLLPNFVNINKDCKKIVDLGTGNAPIPMIFSCLYKDIELYGFEIQKNIYDLAKESIELNHLENRIKLINDDIKNLGNYFDVSSIDVIVSNPPYFKVDKESHLNECEEKTIARHEIKINLDELLKIVSIYLKTGGTFAMVHRTDRLIEIIETMKKYKIEPKRLQLIYPKVNTESNMILIEGRMNGKTGLKILPPLIVHEDNGEYRQEIKDLFKVGDR